MPTPEAVLRGDAAAGPAAPRGSRGSADVMVVDIGGATTDVHSDRAHEAATPGIEDPLLPAPLTLRTVEGDLGLRAGAPACSRPIGRWIGGAAMRRGGDWTGCLSAAPSDPEWIPEEPGRGSARRAAGGRLRDPRASSRHSGTMLLTRGEAGPADPGPRRPRPARGEAGIGYWRGICAPRGRGVRSCRGALGAGRRAPWRRAILPVADRRQLHPRRRRAAGHARPRRPPCGCCGGSFTCPRHETE